jgi:iron uptake system EfeUOB component EfeO/EfeM
MDISDEIVIIDDKSDVERFVDTFQPEKRENIKKLLQYLDGLFEKLPEEVVRKFAQSEYFELYAKIMKELER